MIAILLATAGLVVAACVMFGTVDANREARRRGFQLPHRRD
jgi:hypothetical protein